MRAPIPLSGEVKILTYRGGRNRTLGAIDLIGGPCGGPIHVMRAVANRRYWRDGSPSA